MIFVSILSQWALSHDRATLEIAGNDNAWLWMDAGEPPGM